MPRVAGRSQESFESLNMTLIKLPKMHNLSDFEPWKAELENICAIVPDLSDCFGVGFKDYINECWTWYHRNNYSYLNKLFWSLCKSQTGIRGESSVINLKRITRIRNFI